MEILREQDKRIGKEMHSLGWRAPRSEMEMCYNR